MGGDAAGDSPKGVIPCPHPFLDDRVHEMSSLPIPDELLGEIFLRLPTPADLARASATCVSFRRIAAGRSFVRRFRKLHAPPLLGFLGQAKKFYPAVPPHSSAPAARAVALAADFSFSFLPAPAREWILWDIRDGRFLLDRFKMYGLREMVVCDPLHRRYLLLPPVPDELASWVHFPEICLVPPRDGDGDGAVAADETSFRVVWMAQYKSKLAAFVFSSNTGQWQAIPLLPLKKKFLFPSRRYVYSCFYWFAHECQESKLLVLDTKTMEFSMADPPPPETYSCWDSVMVEAGEGMPGMFVLAFSRSDIGYFIMQNDGGSSCQWQKVKTIALGSCGFFICDMEKHLLLYQDQTSLLKSGCFTLDIETFQLEMVCALPYLRDKLHAYSNFPPSLLSLPTISSGIQEDGEKPMLEQDAEVLPAESHGHHD